MFKHVGIFIVTLLLWFPLLSQAEEFHHVYPAELVRIKDADTMVLKLDLGFDIVMSVDARIHNYDAPETWRPKTLAEERHGEEATAFATTLLPLHFKVRSYDWAVYNRAEVDILLPEGDFAEIMMANGFEKRDSYPEDPAVD